jgi:murein DD-endopeptidase MepM/ murein hydrolase activator NlpD
MTLVQPWPEGKRITSGYGTRRHPVTGKTAKHRGIDIGGRFRVTAAGDGEVVHVGWAPTGGGHVVIIKHDDPAVHTVYYHGRTATKLRKGERVKAGDFIYESGSTGMSTGDHLHWEVRRTRAWGTDTDPLKWLGQSAGVDTDGDLDRDTVKAWQTVLRRDWRYRGRVDGVMGPLSWKAVQESLVAHGYRGPIDGIPGRNTFRALQAKLGRAQTGRLTTGDVKALQDLLNRGGY